MTRAPRRPFAVLAREDGGATGGDERGRPRVGLPDSADGERRRRTIESLRHVERELERTRALLDDVLRRAGADPDADEDPGAPSA